MVKNNSKSGSNVGFNEQFDSRLMNSNSSSDKAGALNEAKRKGPENQPNSSQEEPKTLREAVIAKKRAEAKKKGGKGGLIAKGKASARKAISELLCAAWENLPDSFGLTLIWINIHVFLGLVIGHSLFCKLGEEWLDTKVGGKVPGNNPAKDAALGQKLSEATDKINACANIGESMLLAVLDLTLLLIIGINMLIIAAMIKVVSNPLDFFSALLGWVWSKTGIGPT